MKRVKLKGRILIRCQPSLPVAVAIAAGKNMMSPSEYVRRSLFKSLKKDGVDPTDILAKGLLQT